MSKRKFSASFLGRDCPGEVAAITSLFGKRNCNIEAMSQAMLLGEFIAIFIVSVPEGETEDGLKEYLERGLKEAEADLAVIVREAGGSEWGKGLPREPFVVTVDGPDRPGLIGGVSKVFATHAVNIENLTALLNEMADGNALFVFEVMVPESVDVGRLRRELNLAARELGLRVSMQHRDIFEAVNRVNSF